MGVLYHFKNSLTSFSALVTLYLNMKYIQLTLAKAISLWSITLPTLLGYLFFGMSYGFLMQQLNVSLLYSVLFSLLVYAGSIQYMALAWIVNPLQPIMMFFIALLVNSRHLFYSMSMHERFKPLKGFKPFAFLTLTDETFTTLMMHPNLKGNAIIVVSLLHYLYWSGATLLGHVLGSSLSITIQGLDFVLTALFFSALLVRLSDPLTSKLAWFGLGISALMFLLFPQVVALSIAIALMLVISLWMNRGQRYE
jgi:4-azaleucine resistance transporter AzlC